MQKSEDILLKEPYKYKITKEYTYLYDIKEKKIINFIFAFIQTRDIYQRGA